MFLLRVDDCGWEPTKKNSDRGLEWFRKYRSAGGFEGLPIVWAFIPTTVTPDELNWMHANLGHEERVAVHGWDHADGAVVERKHMDCAKAKLHLGSRRPIDCYVPPFNKYDAVTMCDWASLSTPDVFFFGGFSGEHHKEGPLPTRPRSAHRNLAHLPATKPLYARAHEILDQLPRYQGLQCPIVVTLHVTWDVHGFRGLRELREQLAPELVAPETVVDWLNRSAYSVDQLTAPHFAAYDWILKRINVGDEVLDVGSRYSKLPALISLHGGRVTACDRDLEKLTSGQAKHAAQTGARIATVRWDGSEPITGSYDTISACWAIQHNFPLDLQKGIMYLLSSALKPNGQLLVVSSFSSHESFEQRNREDPQLVLNLAGHDELIQASGLRTAERSFFWYEHATTAYKWCAPQEANAVVYRLIKA
jgi:hypothetical protein